MEIVDYKDDNILKILFEFRDSFYSSTISEEQLQNLYFKFKQFAIFRVLKDDTDNLGFYALYANDEQKKQAFLSMIIVKKEKQGLGYGKKLLLDCIEKAKLNKMSCLKLEVNKKNNRGIAFYNKFGFKLINEIDNSLFMERTL